MVQMSSMVIPFSRDPKGSASVGIANRKRAPLRVAAKQFCDPNEPGIYAK